MDIQQKKEILQKSQSKCWYCGEQLLDYFHVDHVIPVFLGGNNDKKNLVPSCKNCNLAKNKKSLEEFRLYRKRQLAGMPRFNDDQLSFLLSHNIHLPKLPDFEFFFEKAGLL